MELKNKNVAWWMGFTVISLLISFAITLPSVSAQEGTPPIPTATPTGAPAGC